MIRTSLMWLAVLALAPTCLTLEARGEKHPVIEGITFWAEPAETFVPLNEVLKQLHWEAQWDCDGTCVINDFCLTDRDMRSLTGGTGLVSLSSLQAAGASIHHDPEGATWTVTHGKRWLTVRTGAKKVEIDLKTQRLEAWQGDRVVLKCRISSGRNDRTPSGEYYAGPFRARMHRSRRYHNAPMPWSVQINGHIFIHGFSEVPSYPASHGCIRLPLDEGNPAKFFYEWVDDGTPVSVKRG